MLFTHARILITGLGVSGEAAAALCASRGYAVTVTDTRSRAELAPALDRLADLPISYHIGGDPPECTTFTLIVRSPGVPRDLPLMMQARGRGVPVWSEIELAAAMCPPSTSTVAITGTNGKSTTTVLCGELFRAAGRSTHVCGNIGHPLAAAVPHMQAGDAAVIEVSSAQLEDCHAFAPRIAVLTNIRPENMDHYTWQAYVTAKARIVRNHSAASGTVANYDDEHCRQIADSAPGRVLFFGARELPAGREGVFCAHGQVVARLDSARIVVCEQRDLPVPGALPNLLAMMAVGLLNEIPVEVIREAATSYTGREHVMEYVATAAGDIDIYNDSKATNPWCTMHALDALSGRPIVLITGGKDDKNADVDPLAAHLTGRVHHLITLGETGPRTAAAAAAHGMSAITEAEGLPHAIARAIEVAQPGDAVLFSPGANSKDMFPDHRTRGELFKQQVRRLLTAAGQLQPAGR